MNVKFYQVGGSVRDKYLGVKSKDIDYSVEAKSYDEMRDEIVKRDGEIFLETPQYFTIRAKVPNLGACDFVLCRNEDKYEDGRRPLRVSPGTIYDDLARRDFTVNAIAIDEFGNIIDPFGGINDIQNMILRTVGQPKSRFEEDYLRILRAIRFHITKGFNFDSILYDTLKNMTVTKNITKISEDRIREELYRCFSFNTIKTINVLKQFDLFELIFSEFNLKLEPTSRKM